MRILILTPRIPWPPTDGGRVAMARLAESLAAAGTDVEVLSLNPRKHHRDARGPLPIRAIDVDTSRTFVPALRTLATNTPVLVSRFVTPTFRRAVRETIARFAPDVVQIESPFLLPYTADVRAASRARIALRSLNVEFRIWEGLEAIEPSALRRLALRRIARSLHSYEVRAMNAIDAIVPISEADADDFRRLGVTTPMHVTPCGVPRDTQPIDAGEPLTAGFIGSLDFLPNQHAVQWILDELWPRVVARMPDARLTIAGSAPPDWLADRARERNVEMLGNVPDAAAFMRSKAVMLAPLFAGGGMRIKVLEAMALGKPVVATTIGAGGIAYEVGRDVAIADDADTFANAVVNLLTNRNEASRVGANARAMVEERYDVDTLGNELARFYELIGSSRPS